MKAFLGLALVLALVLAPYEVVFVAPNAAVSFPYKSLSDAAKDADGVAPGTCAGEYGALMSVEIPIRYFVLYIGDGKLLVGEWANAETFNKRPPAFLWIGTIDKDGGIVMQSREPFDPAKHGDGPCRLLYPERYI